MKVAQAYPVTHPSTEVLRDFSKLTENAIPSEDYNYNCVEAKNFSIVNLSFGKAVVAEFTGNIRLIFHSSSVAAGLQKMCKQ